MTTTPEAAPHTVADHLLDRLAELGAEHVFGVPGDYTLALLDHVAAHDRVEWVGCTNELDAGYAADAYGRLRGIAALCTTFGVGELSALNAVAGAYAEFVPLVEVVGAPASATQAAHRIVHHSLGDGVFDHFLPAHEPVTCARAVLTAENAAAEIDRVLAEVRDRHLPGYLLVPADVADAPVPRATAPLPRHRAVSDAAAVEAFTSAAARLLGTVPDAGRVTVLTGLLVHRLGAMARFRRLLETHPVRVATTAWAKSTADETLPGYAGLYAGAASDAGALTAVEDAGVLVVAGVQFTDLNSGFFTQHLDRPRTIELAAASASVGEERFDGVTLPDALDVLDRLLAGLPPAPATGASSGPAPASVPPAGGGPAADPAAPLTQKALWDAVARHLGPGDVVLADQGTSYYGMAAHPLPHDALWVGQPLWASIGYTLPALLGVGLADRSRRGVLLVGDGAALMTVQELATVARQGLTPLVVVVDNDGYTVERAIHGPEQAYNDIPRVDWIGLVRALAPDADVRAVRATTVGELDAVLGAAATEPARFTLVQAVVPPLDVPPLLTMIAQAAASANRQRAGG